MAINYWEADEETEVTGNYVNESGGDFPTIPHGTRVLCFIDEAKTDHKAAWDKGKQNINEEDCIKLRFEITAPDDYERQKLFKTFWTETGGDEKLKRDKLLFLNIDKNAGGNLSKLRREATEEELQRHLVGKTMMVIVGMMKDKVTGKENNYIIGVGPSGDITAPSKQGVNKAMTATKKAADLDEEDLPF